MNSAVIVKLNVVSCVFVYFLYKNSVSSSYFFAENTALGNKFLFRSHYIKQDTDLWQVPSAIYSKYLYTFFQQYLHMVLRYLLIMVQCHGTADLTLRSVALCSLGTSSLFSAKLGIGIEETNAGIGIPASRILVRYWTKKMSDCVSLVHERTCSGIVSFFQSGTGLTGCRTVRHSGILKFEP